MKTRFIAASFISASMLFIGCGEAEIASEKTDKATDPVVEAKPCMLSLDNKSVVVNWTAFKLSEKVGVGGTFDSVAITGVSENESMIGAAATAQFDIYTTTVNSKNPERDVKISHSFFGTMINTTTISGKVVSLNEDGFGAISITMNGTEKEVEVQWEAISESRLKLTATVNVPDWEAQPSLDSLNNVCSLLHTGADGTSVLWPDVEIEVFADFKSDCE